MLARLRLFWRQMREQWVIVIIAALVVVIVLIIAGYIFNWSWMGLNGGFSKVTTTKTINTTATATEQPTTRTLWDWLTLLGVLAIPVVVGFGVAWFTRVQQLRDKSLEQLQHKHDQQLADQRAQSELVAAEKRAQTEREIASDNQREAALQAYIDKMSELLLHAGLRESKEEDEVRTIARVRTLTVLEQLDRKRKRSLLQFLYESRLIVKGENKYIIDLDGANLKDANLSDINLREANLKGAYLFDADLRDANLSGADLQCAKLNGADLSTAKLQEADLRRAKYRKEEKREANGVTLKQTQWPQGFNPQAAGAICVDC